MSKVHRSQAFIMPFPYIWFALVYFNNPFFLEFQCRQRKLSERSRRFRPSNKASKNRSRLKMQRGGSELFMVPHRGHSQCHMLSTTTYKAATNICYSAWCAVCYYRYTNRSAGMHQQEVILLAPETMYITQAVSEGGMVYFCGEWKCHHVHPPLLFQPQNHTLYNALDQCLTGDSLSHTTLLNTD